MVINLWRLNLYPLSEREACFRVINAVCCNTVVVMSSIINVEIAVCKFANLFLRDGS